MSKDLQVQIGPKTTQNIFSVLSPLAIEGHLISRPKVDHIEALTLGHLMQYIRK